MIFSDQEPLCLVFLMFVDGLSQGIERGEGGDAVAMGVVWLRPWRSLLCCEVVSGFRLVIWLGERFRFQSDWA